MFVDVWRERGRRMMIEDDYPQSGVSVHQKKFKDNFESNIVNGDGTNGQGKYGVIGSNGGWYLRSERSTLLDEVYVSHIYIYSIFFLPLVIWLEGIYLLIWPKRASST